MAHTLQLSDGSTTVDFLGSSGTSWCLLADGGLLIERPNISEEWSGNRTPYSGGEVVSFVYNNRTVSVTFEIVGDTWDDILDEKTGISKLIDQARMSYSNPGTLRKVYLKWQLDTASKPVYFDVLSGSISSPDDIMSLEKLTWMKGSQISLKECTMSLTCKPFARGDQVTLVNGTDIDNTTDSFPRVNYVTITGSNVLGDVPGPLSFKLTENTSSYGNLSKFWYGLRENYTGFTNILEAEDMTIGLSGTPTTGADFSGATVAAGDGTTVAWSNKVLSTTTGDQVLSYDFSSNDNGYEQAGNVRVFLVGDLQFQNKIQFQLSIYYGSGDEIRFPWVRPLDNSFGMAQVCDVGVISLTPSMIEYGEGVGGFDIRIYARADTSDAVWFSIDAIFLMPTDEGKYRHVVDPNGYGLSETYGRSIHDDGVNDIVRGYYTGSGNYLKALTKYGAPIHITPGVNSRIYFLALQPPDYEAWKTYKVYVYHTPYYYDVRGS